MKPSSSQQMPLGAQNRDQITDFHLEWYQASLGYARAGLALCSLLVMFFYPLDALTLNEQGATFLQRTRLTLMIPILLALLVLSYTRIPAKLFYIGNVFAYCFGASMFVYAGLLSPENSVLYILIALVQTLLFLLIAFRTPWIYCVPGGFFIFAIAIYMAMRNDLAPANFYGFVTGIGATVTILSAAAYLRDRDAYKLFVAQQAVKLAQEEKLKWSILITRFLRHELSNQTVAISTSLSMIERSKDNPAAINTYLQRGKQALNDLRSLLNKTTLATSLEEVVSLSTVLPFTVSDFISDTLFQYENLNLPVEFNVEIASDFVIEGDSTLLGRALGNIIENAIRHQTPGTPISITATTKREIIVENMGDALPSNKQKLFDMGQAGLTAKHGMYGLGLFIVKKIMEAHSGTVSAYDLISSSGAKFVLGFPARSLKKSI